MFPNRNRIIAAMLTSFAVSGAFVVSPALASDAPAHRPIIGVTDQDASIDTPADGKEIVAGVTTISGGVKVFGDKARSVRAVLVKDGQPDPVVERNVVVNFFTGKWEFTQDLTPGTYTLTVKGSTLAQSTSRFTVIAQSISIDTPADGKEIVAGVTTISGGVKVFGDKARSVRAVLVKDGQPDPVVERDVVVNFFTGKWEFTQDLTPGTYTLTVKDRKDNPSASETSTFTVTK